MEEAGVQIRLARPEDVEQIRHTIRITLANPEGRAQRKRYEDAVQRQEMLVLTRYESRERMPRVFGFIEWHTRVDGAVTIRDAGTVGDTPHVGTLKRLVREMLRMLAPPSATVKVRADQPLWNSIFEETPGFRPEGKEYSRPYWRQIWTWTAEAERAVTRPARPAGARPPGGRPAGSRSPHGARPPVGVQPLPRR